MAQRAQHSPRPRTIFGKVDYGGMPLYYPPSTSPGAEVHDPLLYRGHAFVEKDTRDAATGRDTGAPPDPGGVSVLLLLCGVSVL